MHCAQVPKSFLVNVSWLQSPPADLTDVVAAWAQGTPFFDIYKMMEVFEVRLWEKKTITSSLFCHLQELRQQ